jgi:prevent-host-death family protein
MQVNIHQAKTHLSALLLRVVAGEEITIARAGVPVARLVAVEPPRNRRVLGVDRGAFEVPEDFDAPLPDEVLADFYGGELPKLTSKRQGRRQRR